MKSINFIREKDIHRLIIIRGLPGAGKTTFAKKMYKGIAHYEADMFFERTGTYIFDRNKLLEAHDWCQNKVYRKILKGKDVVVSNTFTRIFEIMPYLEMLNDTEHIYDITIVELFSDYGSIHNVPDKTLANMKARWENIPHEYYQYLVQIGTNK